MTVIGGGGPTGSDPSGGGSNYSNAILADSPTAYWEMQETSGTTLTDSSGNGYNGTYPSDVVLGQTGAFSGDLSVDFTGSIGIDTTYTPSTTSMIFSMEAWVNLTGVVSGNYAYIFGDFFHSLRVLPSNELDIYATDNHGNYELTYTTPINKNTWYYVVATQSSSELTLYVNGTQVASTPSAITGPMPTNYAMRIGYDENLVNPFPGYMSQIAFYDGVALTPTQIQNHYTAATAVPISLSGSSISDTYSSSFLATFQIADEPAFSGLSVSKSATSADLSIQSPVLLTGSIVDKSFTSSDLTVTGLVSNGLVAVYAFDEGSGNTVHDSSGNAFDATFPTSSNYTWSQQGLVFNGGGVGLTNATLASLLSGGTGFTLQVVFLTANPESNDGSSYLIDAPNSFQVQLRTQFCSFIYTSKQNINGSSQWDKTTLGNAQWYLGEMDWDGNTSLGTYVNNDAGTIFTTQSGSTLNAPTSNEFYMGANGNSGSDPSAFKGTIAYVVVYNRGLSSAERQQNQQFFQRIMWSRGNISLMGYAPSTQVSLTGQSISNSYTDASLGILRELDSSVVANSFESSLLGVNYAITASTIDKSFTNSNLSVTAPDELTGSSVSSSYVNASLGISRQLIGSDVANSTIDIPQLGVNRSLQSSLIAQTFDSSTMAVNRSLSADIVDRTFEGSDIRINRDLTASILDLEHVTGDLPINRNMNADIVYITYSGSDLTVNLPNGLSGSSVSKSFTDANLGVQRSFSSSSIDNSIDNASVSVERSLSSNIVSDTYYNDSIEIERGLTSSIVEHSFTSINLVSNIGFTSNVIDHSITNGSIDVTAPNQMTAKSYSKSYSSSSLSVQRNLTGQDIVESKTSAQLNKLFIINGSSVDKSFISNPMLSKAFNLNPTNVIADTFVNTQMLNILRELASSTVDKTESLVNLGVSFDIIGQTVGRSFVNAIMNRNVSLTGSMMDVMRTSGNVVREIALNSDVKIYTYADGTMVVGISSIGFIQIQGLYELQAVLQGLYDLNITLDTLYDLILDLDGQV